MNNFKQISFNQNHLGSNLKIFNFSNFVMKEDKSNFSHNVTTWTNEEEQKLLDNIKNMGLKKLSKTLNKSTFDTIMKYYELNEKSNYKNSNNKSIRISRLFYICKLYK